MIIHPPISLATVDPERPLSDHPRNRGVVAAWLTLAFSNGGSRLVDLRGRYDGTLPTSGIARAPASRANGYGELSYDYTAKQYVTLPDMTAEFGAQEATIACWLRLRSATPDGSLGGSGLFDFGSNNTGKQIAFPFSDNCVYISTFDSGRPIEAVTAPANLTSWNHLVLSSAAGTGNYKMYWNGTPFVARDRTGFYLPTAPRLGGDFLNFWFDGWMDDVWLWSRALSDAEVQAHYVDSLTSYADALRRTPTYVGFAAPSGLVQPNRVGAIGYVGNYAY